jgi:hypothetical protein
MDETAIAATRVAFDCANFWAGWATIAVAMEFL